MKTLFLLLLIFIAIPAVSQSNFVPGFIRTIDGDSIPGEINDLYWSTSPIEVQFRSDSGSKTYFPKDLLEFGVGNKVLYLSRHVQYDSSSHSGQVSNSFNPSYKQAYLFLRMIVKSKLSLLEYRENQVSHFFIQDENLTELVNHTFVSNVGGYADEKRE